MKREDLKKLLGDSATDEAIDKIMSLHGADVESHKGKLTTAQTEIDGLKGQLTEASAAIEGFKKLNPEQLQAAADDWKAKAEQAQTDAAAQVATLKFDHALESALTGAKARNPKAVTALLSRDALKLQDDGSILGLKEQLETIQKDNDYLFESDKPEPRVVAGGNNQPVITDAFEAAMWKGAGLKPPGQQ
jgi:hypothetical protein